MTLVERFIDLTDWPTSRKTVFLASVAALSQLGNTGILVWLRPDAVDLPMLARILLGGGVVSVGVVVVSWISYKRGSEGRWTGYLLTVTFAACVDAFAISQGLLVTPIIAVALLVPLLVAVIYDIRMAMASLACYAIPILGAAVLVLAGAIPFAPTMEVRDLDGLKTGSYFAFVLFTLTVVSAAVYLSGFMAVAAGGLQRRRLVDARAA